MNDPNLAITNLEGILDAARADNVSTIESCALYAAAEAVIRRLQDHLDETMPDDGYAQEKLGNARFHIAAALGFDIDNGHSPDKHRVWALGDLSNLQSRFKAD